MLTRKPPVPLMRIAQEPVFLTWRLYRSLPTGREFPAGRLNFGPAFLAADRLLDGACGGTFYLRRPALARIVVEAIQHYSEFLGQFICHAYSVMPNHVHLLATPGGSVPELTASLKSVTAECTAAVLNARRKPFWEDEHAVCVARGREEFEQIRVNIEENPVRAGQVRRAGDYPWSSAARCHPRVRMRA